MQAVVVLVFIVVLFFLIMETHQGWNVVQFMMLVGAMAAVLLWAVHTADLSTWAGFLCLSAIVGLAALANSVPIVDCSRCSVRRRRGSSSGAASRRARRRLGRRGERRCTRARAPRRFESSIKVKGRCVARAEGGRAARARRRRG